MKTLPLRSNIAYSLPVALCLGLAATPSVRAANFTTNTQQAAGANWNAAIWNPGPVSPTAGSTYEVLVGGRVRPPDGSTGAGGTGLDGQTFTFPGDSLTLDGVGFSTTGQSGELRLKQGFNGATFAFPGVGGNPGLIFNGGILNDGDDRIMTLSGLARVQAGTTSSINPGGGATTDISAPRAFIFSISLTGGGKLALDYGHDTGTPALRIDSSNPLFTGDWLVNSGWLKGAGLNSLGFGNIFLNSTQGASTLDLDYDLNNPAGSLTLAGTTSKLILDQNLTLGAVTINGTSLTPGVHTFAELNAAFDGNIVDGGTGTVTVVPEPSSAVALLAGIPIVVRRRRRN